RPDSRNRDANPNKYVQRAYEDVLAYVVNLSNPMTPAIAEFIKWHPIPGRPLTTLLRATQAMEDPATYDAGKMAMRNQIIALGYASKHKNQAA
ncbi:MAG: hypothetical protein WD449_02695, partial [Candidatus Babeliales bacterium]